MDRAQSQLNFEKNRGARAPGVFRFVPMSFFGSITAILIATLVAGFITTLIHRFIDGEFRRRHHDVGSVVFLQLGVVFAVLLAFVFSEAWSEYDEAAKSINLEVSALHGVAMMAATLPPADAKPILAAEKAYLSSVVDEEWPKMTNVRKEDRKTDDLLTHLVQSIANLRLADPDERDKKNAILSLLADAHKQRETRIYQAQNGIPVPLWWVLIGFTMTLALFVSLSAVEYASTAIIIAACFTAGTTSILIMARLLDYPFEGALGLRSSDFSEVIEKVSGLLNQIGAS